MNSGTVMGQSLFKDLYAGAHPLSSNPTEYYNAEGTMYIITRATNGVGLGNYQLWKSDGTVAGTVMVKDSLYTNSTSGNVKFCVHVGSTLYFTITPSGGPSVTTQLWKTDGTEAGTVPVIDLPYTAGSPGSQTPGGYVANGRQTLFPLRTGARKRVVGE